MPQELCEMTISQLAPKIKARAISPVELVRSALARTEKLNPVLNAYITVDADGALDAAHAAEQQIAGGGYLGPLHGIPVSLKDIYQTAGLRTTAGSKILGNWVPEEDATSVAKLRAAGAIIMAKANLHEFALGSTSDNPHYGAVRNPYNTDCIPGGSSGGSAAAVAAGMCIASTGSDTGGSIRSPSALCGIVGIKPTYGRVSLHGVVPLAWSLDHMGPMTKCVRDAAIMLRTMAGRDPEDPTTSRMRVPSFVRALRNDVKNLKIGVDSSFCFSGAHEEVIDGLKNALRVMEQLGARIVEVNLPSIEFASAIEAVLVSTEGASFHEENLRHRADDFGTDVRAVLEFGASLSARHYLKAQRLRRMLQNEFAEAFEKVDVFALPGAIFPAPKLGETNSLQMGRLRFTCPSNLTGLPAITVPCGLSKNGLPLGFQLVGRAFDEATVLRAAYTFERNTEPIRKPSL
jgi:aspartyl-tRNA(Asn)/glutamyl-tRNA(Gln) amidotransferase subunit A